jgi:S1-C subfamily serine protease
VLARFRVTFDYTRHRLLLKPTADAARRTVWNASGMLVAQLPGGPVLVAQIVPGTPAAEAGIAAGDLLVLVGDRPAESIGLDALRAHFRLPGQRDTLVIERDGARHTVALVQRELP